VQYSQVAAVRGIVVMRVVGQGVARRDISSPSDSSGCLCDPWETTILLATSLCSWGNFFLYGGELYFFSTRLARVLIPITCICELWTSFKVLEDQLVGPATHAWVLERPRCTDGDGAVRANPEGGEATVMQIACLLPTSAGARPTPVR
jgi:hypothetical protein